MTMTDEACRTCKIRDLNDTLRTTGVGGRLLITPGVVARGEAFIVQAMTAMREAAETGRSCCIGTADGRAVRPPPELCALMWPAADDGAEPWITELGWTLVPAGSEPQAMHADIVAEYDDQYLRKRGKGRFHHIAWKPCGKRPATTNVVDG